MSIVELERWIVTYYKHEALSLLESSRLTKSNQIFNNRWFIDSIHSILSWIWRSHLAIGSVSTACWSYLVREGYVSMIYSYISKQSDTLRTMFTLSFEAGPNNSSLERWMLCSADVVSLTGIQYPLSDVTNCAYFQTPLFKPNQPSPLTLATLNHKFYLSKGSTPF